MSTTMTQLKPTTNADGSRKVPPGYKRTEVGFIPEDWEAVDLLGIIEISNGFAFQSQYFVAQGPYKLTTPGHFFENGGFRDIGTKQKYYDGPVPKGYLLQPGDFIVAMTEQADGLLGSAALIPADEEGYIHNQRLGKVRSISANVVLGFLYYVFNSEHYRSKVRQTAIGTKVQHTSPRKLKEIVIPLPPPPKQRAIMRAFSDIDGLIEALNKLIAKKRAIKQASMQLLLTGKTRLPGFSGEWKMKRIGELFNIRVGSSKTKYITEAGEYWIVDMGSVATDGRLIVSKPTDYNGDFLKTGELVMPKDDIGEGKIIGKVAYIDADDRYVLGDHVYVLRIRDGHPLFFSYLINRYETNRALRSKVGGTAQLGLARKAVLEQELSFPVPEEQKDIAIVLSEMNAEIAALERRRDKSKAIKQGMMQSLLTGRIRIHNKGQS